MLAVVAGRRSDCAEIALQHRRRRDEVLNVGWILAVNRPLIAAEEEKLVTQDGTARCAAELVPFERAVYFLAGTGIDPCEIIRRIQQIVANKFKEASVEIIRARHGHRIHLRAGMLPLRGRQRAGFDFEFLKRIRKR